MKRWILGGLLMAAPVLAATPVCGGPGAPSATQVPPATPFGPPTFMPPAPPSGPVDFYGPPQPMFIRDYAWSYFEPPKPREVKIHDLITVIVKEAAETNATSRYNRQRNGQYTAQLRQFIRINHQGNLDNAAENSPEVDSQLQSRLQSTGQVTESEAIKYRITATVVDILPNGLLVLEARKSIVNNGDHWEYSLTGKCRPEDVSRDNTVMSENMADCLITKGQSGKLSDSTKRAWFIRLYDWIGPF